MKILVKYLCTLSCFLLFWQEASAYPFRQFMVKEGMISNSVNTIYTCPDGYVWLGSKDGVSQFKQGVFVEHPIAMLHKFTNITDIISDNEGGIWIASYGQGILYIKGDQHFVLTTENGLVSNRVNRLFIVNSNLYIGTDQGVSIYSTIYRNVTTPSLGLVEPLFEVSGFFSNDNEVYMTTINHGTYLLGDQRLILVNTFPHIFSVYRHNNHVFYGTKKGITVIDFLTNTVVEQKKTSAIRTIRESGGVVYFLGEDDAENRAVLYKWEDDKLVDISKQIGIVNGELKALSIDGERGLIYVGSGQHGLFQVNLDKMIAHDDHVQNITTFAENHNTIYLFGKEGLSIQYANGNSKNVSKEVFKIFQEKNYKKFISKSTVKKQFYDIDYNLSANRLLFYKAVVEKDYLYVSSNLGLFKLSLSGNIVDYYNIHTFQYTFLQGLLIESIPYGGVRIYKNLEQFEYVYFSRGKSVHIPRDVVDMQVVDDKVYFASALDGLYSFSIKEGFKSFLTDDVFEESRLKLISNAHDGEFYVSTDFNDIYKFSRKGNGLTADKVVDNSELVGTSVNVLTYADERLIVGTNLGLTVLRGRTRFVFDEEQGYLNTEVSEGKVVGDQLVVVGASGVSKIDLSYFTKRKQSCVIELADIVVNGVSRKELTMLPKIHLRHVENSLEIKFTFKKVKYPNKIKFQYRLKALGDWEEVGGTVIGLKYLEPGSYPIELLVQDFDTGETLIYPLIDLEIKQPFYFSLWFYFITALVVIVIIYLFYLRRVRRIERLQVKRQDRILAQKRMSELKLLAVRSQMNSHFIFNVLSSIQYYILQDADQASSYLGKFSKILRESLDLSYRERISFSEELAYLDKYVEIENMRMDGRLNFEVSSILPLKSIMIPPMLLQPFVENAIIHAFPLTVKNPKISITILAREQGVEIYIRDNGIGYQEKRKEKTKHESKGLIIVRERISIIQDYLEDDVRIETSDKGTTVIIYLKNVLNTKQA